MTYMGQQYYPQWLDNLADDVTLEAAAMEGAAQGAKDVGAILVAARRQYENQVFSYAGPCGDHGFLEEYTTEVRGVPTRVVVLVTYNAAGQTQRVVVNHRPRGALLSFSRVMLEQFSGTPLAKHWEGTP
jgi:ABC-type arginine transport system permease subunit